MVTGAIIPSSIVIVDGGMDILAILNDSNAKYSPSLIRRDNLVVAVIKFDG